MRRDVWSVHGVPTRTRKLSRRSTNPKLSKETPAMRRSDRGALGSAISWLAAAATRDQGKVVAWRCVWVFIFGRGRHLRRGALGRFGPRYKRRAGPERPSLRRALPLLQAPYTNDKATAFSPHLVSLVSPLSVSSTPVSTGLTRRRPFYRSSLAATTPRPPSIVVHTRLPTSHFLPKWPTILREAMAMAISVPQGYSPSTHS